MNDNDPAVTARKIRIENALMAAVTVLYWVAVVAWPGRALQVW